MTRWCLVALLLCLPACASLVLRDSDSVGAKAGKVAARTLLFFPTFTLSEIWVADAKRELEREDEERRFRVGMDALVGHMTMDDVVSKLGPPTSVYEGTEIIVAEWSSRSTATVAVPIGGMVMALPLHHGRDLRLTFDRESKLLRQWTDSRY
jgi:hypothetical protein